MSVDFLALLQFSYAYKYTILDGIVDKHMVYPGPDQTRAVYNEALEILKNYCSKKFNGNKEAFDKLQPDINRCYEIVKEGRDKTIDYSFGDQYHMSIKFNRLRALYNAILKLEDEILEKQAQEKIREQIEEQKRLLKREQEMNDLLFNVYPNSNK
jgi:hypothetical protein